MNGVSDVEVLVGGVCAGMGTVWRLVPRRLAAEQRKRQGIVLAMALEGMELEVVQSRLSGKRDAGVEKRLGLGGV